MEESVDRLELVCWQCRLAKPLKLSGLCPECEESWVDPTAIDPPAGTWASSDDPPRRRRKRAAV